MMKIKDVAMKTAYTRMQNTQHQFDFKLKLNIASKLYLIQSYDYKVKPAEIFNMDIWNLLYGNSERESKIS